MKKYKAISATLNRVLEWEKHGKFYTQFHIEALEELAQTAIGKPVLINFDPVQNVGKVTNVYVEKGQLVVEFESDIIIDKGLRLVPGFKTEKDFWEEKQDVIRNIYSCKSVNYGLTFCPIEKDLPEIKEQNQ